MKQDTKVIESNHNLFQKIIEKVKSVISKNSIEQLSTLS